MSANQKQPPSVVPQSQSRYAQAQYIPQRPLTPQRSDGYHVGTPPAYVQQPPPNQVNNQVQPLRGMPPAGPPNQSSTPPNNDLKVQQMSQQPMNITYVQQSQMRPQGQQNYFARAPAPTNQTRIPNHRQGQQAIYQTQPPQYVPMPLSHHMTYVNASPAALQYFNNNPRPQNFVASGYQMIGQQLPAYSYQQPQAHPPSYYYNAPIISRAAPQVPTTPQNPTQPPPTPNMVLPPQLPPHNTIPKNKRRSNAIPIIDPNTGRDRLNEMYEQEQDGSHPPSGESSARHTPQPPLPNPNKEVQAAFAKQVAQAIGKDEPPTIEDLDHQPSVHEHMAHMYSLPNQAVHSRIELVQSSKLQAATKEFIPASLSSTAKEITPVVSAITDAVEVTITNKPKDRESPAKNRKQREHLVVRDNKEKEISKDIPVSANISSCSKDDIIQKDVVLSIGSNKDGVCQRDDKKTQQKVDVKPSQSPCVSVSEENLSDSGPVIPSSIPETTTFYSTKSKSNSSQKTKDVPKQSQQMVPPTAVQPPPQQPQKAAQSPPLSVPASQPVKPTNRNNKMRELNIKGASKEGTDMDAYNDNIIHNDAAPVTNNTTANVASVNHSTNDNSETIEYINNSNNLMLNNNVNITNSTVEAPAEKIESSTNDNVTIKPIETKSKKVDVTDIVLDIPRPCNAATLSQFNSATTNSSFKQSSAPNSLESQDETDRAAVINEKLVQTKNESNKSSTPENNTNDVRSRLSYRDDQWSPTNVEGKKIYARDFLLALSKDPQSLKRPDNLPADIMKHDEKSRVGDISRFSMGPRGGPDFSPNFSSNSYPSKSSSQRGAVTKRKSNQGTISTSKGGMSNKPQVRITLSLKDNIKLHEAENAWRPACLAQGTAVTEYEKHTADLYKKVRGVLNKLTPQKFDTLLGQIRTLKIDNPRRLQGVIDLVFEKAVDEPNFSVAYALLCRELSLMQVPINDDGADKNKESSTDVKKDPSTTEPKKEEYVNFRKLLVTRCQMEFEKNSMDESARNSRVELIDNCADPEKKKEMLLELEDYDRRLRMKSVGNIRFIGELFKQNMLTVNIMQRCLSNLLETKDEESLECLCKLLTTIGQVLDNKKIDLNSIFQVMKEIVDRKHGKVSSRVRFMLQDVIDLRLSNWVPRRQDLNPKTMDQIQKEAENEQLNIQAMNSVPITSRRDDRGAGSSNKNSSSSNKKYGTAGNEEGWSTQSSRNRVFSIQSDKLKSKPPTGDEPLGSSMMFGSWVRGASIKVQPPLTNTTNMYSALETLGNNECDKRPNLNMRSSNKGPYNSKGPSLDRNYNRQYDGRGSRSGSQHRSRDSSAASQRNAAPVASVQPAPKPQPTFVEPTPEPANVVELSLDLMGRKFKNILDEFINDCCGLNECEQDIRNSIPPTVLPQLILDGCLNVLERSKVARMRTGTLFSHIIKSGVLSVQDYCKGLESVMNETLELIIDIPTIWEFVAELIAPVLWENSVSFRDIYKAFEEPIRSNHAHKLLAYIFKLFIVEKGPGLIQTLWKNSNFALTDFMSESQAESFIADNNFGFLLDSSNSAISASSCQTQLSYEEIHDKLLAFFKENTSFDTVIDWISANVGQAVTENHFIRTLATACFESAIVNEKLKVEILQDKFDYFIKFVDGNSTYELQCLFALQSLIHKLEHPQGLLLSICDKLYQDSVFSLEGFIAWETNSDPAEQEGKGVALKQLTAFFLELKAEESSSASDEA